MENIKIWNRTTPEYKRLTRAATILTAYSPRKCVYKVEDIYFDYGQDWTWTTIVCYPPNDESGYQALYPAQQEKILTAENLLEALAEIVQETYWLDK